MAKKRPPPKLTGGEKPLSASVFTTIMKERNQAHDSRVHLIRKIEREIGCPVITFFTSFRYRVIISDNDADIIEDMLRSTDLTNGLAMIISSPGGSGLAAERIINLCRRYSGTGTYRAIVPGKAKSAATLVCFGASEIAMGVSSELGPVDPQILLVSDDSVNQFALHNVVASYKDLFRGAVDTKGNLEPFLQQLGRYDAKEIAEYESEIALSKDMAVKALRTGMMSGKSEDYIQKKIETFLTPELVKSHGRPIFRDEARKCGLRVRFSRPSSRAWKLIHELYVRTHQYVNSDASKCVETSEDAFYAEARR